MLHTFVAPVQDKLGVFNRIALVGLMCFASLNTTPGMCQSSKAPATAPTSLSNGVDMGRVKINPLSGEKRATVFQLSTSWIPGEGSKGYIRYRISVAPDGGDLNEVIAYMHKLNSCSFNLELYDSEHFKLRSIPLLFIREVASSGDVVAMSANDMFQMGLAEYKSFISGGNWTISWGSTGGCSI